jgi:hypothetical protein
MNLRSRAWQGMLRSYLEPVCSVNTATYTCSKEYHTSRCRGWAVGVGVLPLGEQSFRLFDQCL